MRTKAYLIFAEQEAPDRLEVELPQEPRQGEAIFFEDKFYDIQRVVYATATHAAQIHLFLSAARHNLSDYADSSEATC